MDEAGHIGWLRAVVNLVRNVNTGDVHMYTLRIAPYRTTENSIRGLVITIIDSLGAQD